jgi:RNA polymerase sporulation-specific sigma factor
LEVTSWKLLQEPCLLLAKCIFVLAHVTGNNSFPQPLSPEEEAYHLKQYAQGYEESRNVLIEHNLRLVAHIVKKYSNTGKEIDDLISIGTIGLIKAISTYNAERKTRLATYAARCIENEILMTIERPRKRKGEVSLQDPIGIDKEGNEITLIDILGTDADMVTDQVELKLQTKKLRKMMQTVLKKERTNCIGDALWSQ